MTSQKRAAPATPVVLEPEYIRGLTELFEEKIVFNRLLGLKIVSIQPERVSASLAMLHDQSDHPAWLGWRTHAQAE